MVKLTESASLDKVQGRKFNGSSYILLFIYNCAAQETFIPYYSSLLFL